MHTLFHITQITTTTNDSPNGNNNIKQKTNTITKSQQISNDNETFSFQGKRRD